MTTGTATLIHVVCVNCNKTNRVPADRLDRNPRCGQCGHALFEGRPAELDTAGFERHVANSDLPVVVDFWASWCGPCMMMAPEFEKAAAALEPDARLVKINTEAEQALAARFNIRSIPTLAVFRNGREVTRQAGAMRAADIESFVRAAL